MKNQLANQPRLFLLSVYVLKNIVNSILNARFISMIILFGLSNQINGAGLEFKTKTTLASVNKAVCCPPYGAANLTCNALVWSSLNFVKPSGPSNISSVEVAIKVPYGFPTPDHVYITDTFGKQISLGLASLPLVATPSLDFTSILISNSLYTWHGFKSVFPSAVNLIDTLYYRVVYVWDSPSDYCRYITGEQYIGSSAAPLNPNQLSYFAPKPFLLCEKNPRCGGILGSIDTVQKCVYPFTSNFFFELTGINLPIPVTNHINGYFDNLPAGTYTLYLIDSTNNTKIDSTTFTLTVDNTISSTTVTACDSYTWSENNTTYTISGVFNDTTIFYYGSDSCLIIEILDLTISNSTTSSETATACDSYVWACNGQTYTASGIYTCTSLNAAGCLNTATLNLTINQSTSTTTNLTACDLYTWPLNGQTYTTSGLYSHSSLNAAGCVNTEYLNLTINGTTVSSLCGVEACDSYTWAQNGITYTASGSYYWIGQNASGCPDVYTLCLTINQPSTSIETISACNSYTWSNGVTYTASGQYSYTYINALGCASTHILNLNLNSGVVISANAMLRGAYDASTGLMKDSLRRVTHFQTPGTLPSDGQFSVGAPVNVIPLTRIAFASELPCANDNEISIGGGNAATAAVILAVSGPDAIIDWVLIEVRDGSNYNTVVNTKNALIQRDGDVVSCIDGISPLSFSCVCPGNYYISIKHRNHLGVMTANTVALSSTSTTVPFSDATIPVWAKLSIANSPRSTAIGSVATLWGGDANTNKNAKYNGLSNDKEVILTDIGGTGNSNIILYQIYKKSDLNMDGKVHYNNADNDKNWLLNFVYNLSIPFTPNNVIGQHTPN